MNIDLRTAYFMATMVAALDVGLFFIVWLMHRSRIVGIGFWVLSLICMSMHYMLISMRDMVSPILSVIVANLLLIISSIFAHRGVVLFRGRTWRYWPLYGILLCVNTFVYSWYLLVVPNIAARMLCISLTMLCIMALIAWDIHRDVRPALRITHYLSAAIFYGLALLFCLEFISLLSSSTPLGQYFSINERLRFLITLMILGGLFWPLGCVLMISNRLEVNQRMLTAQVDEAAQVLETQILERTAELNMAKQMLEEDVEQRKQSELIMREAERQLHELSQRLITGQEEERALLARELHDDLGQQLSRITLDLERLKIETPGEAARFTPIIETMTNAMGNLRGICKGLHPVVLKKLGLSRAVEVLAQDYRGVLNVSVSSRLPSTMREMSDKVALNIYRIIQEALSNVVRHSLATRVEITLSMDASSLQARIADNGRGFLQDQVAARVEHAGIGLRSMHERAVLCGGTLSIESPASGGTIVHLSIPIHESQGEHV